MVVHRRLCIAMCCDFFFPRLGGVEMHMWSLSQCLLRRGHKVIVLTHAVPGPVQPTSPHLPTQRTGVRYMTHGLKVYYLPMLPIVDNVTYPTIFNHLALFRAICVRERVDIVHGHQATSAFMHECLMQAKALGRNLKTVYTDHSLFGFADAASVHLNKIMKVSMSTVDAAIGVSHTCRENLVLRASLRPEQVATIPNAVDATKFLPPTTCARAPEDPLTVVIISRLVYRKGIDLVTRAIPLVCAQDARVHFLIGGDGPKRLLLEEMRDKYRLHDRVTLYGAVPHATVRDVLCRGHIFLNSSLTESFCIAILEAAACGLFVVSTRVGGVPEVLPPDMVQFAADITPEALAQAVLDVVPRVARVDRRVFHDRVAKMYNWDAVAERTEKVYEKVCALPDTSLLHRLQLYRGVGPVAGLLACVVVAVLHVYVCFLDWWQPAAEIEIALDW
ncbi:hypothetical protein PsorP6_007355 [Peronosclerospora sorghi]|uniref:Uncharacterized protein n=1 Tax=Peronosclerospora sorghi TaxID=230839 RepID=A0ACC0W9F3_9STRA|nr:hypothetical protein PsorP6_007355 [Peronosclerospora sorghi]